MLRRYLFEVILTIFVICMVLITLFFIYSANGLCRSEIIEKSITDNT